MSELRSDGTQFLAIGTLLVAMLVPTDIDSDGGGGGVFGNTGASAVHVYSGGEAAAQGAPSSSGSGSTTRWIRHAICSDWGRTEGWSAAPGVWATDAIPDCTPANPAVAPTVTCPDGQVALEPWWSSRLEADGSYAPWTLASSYQCAADLLMAQVEQAWATMPIAPNTYAVEPSAGFAIAELGVNLMVDTNPRTMDVTLMGTPVTIRAVPTQYVWTNTDGTTWTSTSPGAPYEQGGTPFTFPRTPEHRTTFTLTTTWRGEFTINNGATWRDAPGTATTTSTSTTVHVYNPHTHLVDCDLNGDCIVGRDGGGNQKTILDPDGDGIDNYLIPDNLIGDYLTARDNGTTWTNTDRKH